MRYPLVPVTLAALALAAATATPAVAQIRPSVCDAVASNLVQNCGFEQNSVFPAPFAGWTFSQAPVGRGIASNSGLYEAAFFSPNGGPGSFTSGAYAAISQVLATTPGQTYTISFYGALAGRQSNGLRVLFGGVDVFEQALGGSGMFQQYTFTGVATGASTTFEVDGYHDCCGFNVVDDFVVLPAAPTPPGTTVPEPGTWALLGAGLAIIGASAARRRLAV